MGWLDECRRRVLAVFHQDRDVLNIAKHEERIYMFQKWIAATGYAYDIAPFVCVSQPKSLLYRSSSQYRWIGLWYSVERILLARIHSIDRRKRLWNARSATQIPPRR